MDTVAAWIDQRVQTSTFTAEQSLTKDTVPVDVDIMRLSFLRWTSVGRANGVLLYERATNRLEAEERLYLLDFRGRTDPDGWDRAYDNTGRFRMQEDSEKIFRKKRLAGTFETGIPV